MKWKVYWWIRGAGRKCQGHDIVEAEELDDVDAEELIKSDLAKNLEYWGIRHKPSPIGSKREAETPTNLPNFKEKHTEIMNERHVSNWGVRKVKKVQQK